MKHDGLRIARFILVLSSLSPLFILWGVRGSEAVGDEVWILFCAAMVIVPNVFLGLQLHVARRRGNRKTIEVKVCRDQTEQLLVYLFAMLIPLFGVELNGIRGLAALLLAVLFVAFIFWHMQLHYMNLFWAIFGYRIFTVETASEGRETSDSRRSQSYVVISKRESIESGKPLTGLRLGGNVLVDDGINDRARI
jgi:ABC-type xylose transport system permease subunit